MASTETTALVRLFRFHRSRDVTGFSGVGVVADGVVWPDGTVSMRWRGVVRTTVEASCLDDIRSIHGHDGATHIVSAITSGGAVWTAV